jgi:hypothetical protein
MKRSAMTAAELSAKLEADPEFVARRRERDIALAEKVARHRAEQNPIVAELLSVGVEVQSLSDLVMRSAPYPTAIPILLKHLVLPYSDVTRATLARALAVPDARDVWPVLAAEYRKAPIGEQNELGAKDGLAVAVAASATASVMAELIALAKDRSNGDSRLLLLRALRKSKTPAAKQALDELASDPALAQEIASWRRNKRKR